jgi:hemoglobin-like flavoprotein
MPWRPKEYISQKINQNGRDVVRVVYNDFIGCHGVRKNIFNKKSTKTDDTSSELYIMILSDAMESERTYSTKNQLKRTTCRPSCI